MSSKTFGLIGMGGRSGDASIEEIEAQAAEVMLAADEQLRCVIAFCC